MSSQTIECKIIVRRNIRMFVFLFSLALCQIDEDANPLEAIQQYRSFGQNDKMKRVLDKQIKKLGKQTPIVYYRLRAEAEANLGMSEEALEDIETAMKKNPDAFEQKQLYTISANEHLRMGDAEQALADAQLAEEPSLTASAKELTKLLKQAEDFIDDEKYADAAKVYDRILPICTRALELRQKRADIAWMLRQTLVFENNMRETVKAFYENDADLDYRFGVSLICNGKFDEGKKHIAKAEEIDEVPDEAKQYLKLASSQGSSFRDAENNFKRGNYDEAMRIISKYNQSMRSVCGAEAGSISKASYLAAKIAEKQSKLNDAVDYINTAVEIDTENEDYIRYKADLCYRNKDFNAAVFEYTRLSRKYPNDAYLANALQRAMDGKKKASAVDYYKILGLPRGCTKTQIKDAYRKLARKWHPDQYPDPAEKKKAEDTMKEINTAYDILSDAEKRRYYDAGGDMEQFQAWKDQQNMRNGGVVFEQ